MSVVDINTQVCCLAALCSQEAADRDNRAPHDVMTTNNVNFFISLCIYIFVKYDLIDIISRVCSYQPDDNFIDNA